MSVTASPVFSGSVRVGDGLVVLVVAGDVDVATAPLLQGLLGGAIALGAPRITVDLSGVTFMDARGLTALVRAAESLRTAGGRLTIRSVPEAVHRLFELTGLAEALGADRPAISASLVQVISGAVSVLSSRDVLDAALKLVVRMAHAVVQGAHGVSITLPRYGQFATVAASNDVVLEMDHDQYDTGQGPCLDAANHGQRFSSPTLAMESRWPAFVPRARARGIESILSTPLLTAGQPVGALNIYSRTAGAFAEFEQRWADEFATEAAAVVSSAQVGVSAEQLSAQIERALLSREAIALAQGMVIQRDGGSARAAYASLTAISRRTGVPLQDVCEELVHPPGAAGSASGLAEGSTDGRAAD